MTKLSIQTIDRQTGMEPHDLLREGSAPTLDPILMSAIVLAFMNEINRLSEEVEKLTDAVKRTGRMARKTKKLVTIPDKADESLASTVTVT